MGSCNIRLSIDLSEDDFITKMKKIKMMENWSRIVLFILEIFVPCVKIFFLLETELNTSFIIL